MKRIALYSILLLLISTPCFAEKYYVFFEKLGRGGNDKGDLISYAPYTKQYEPTKAERQRYKIKVIDTEPERLEALMENEVEQYTDFTGQKLDRVVRQRKKKIDVDKLPAKENLKWSELNAKVIVKPRNITAINR